MAPPQPGGRRPRALAGIDKEAALTDWCVRAREPKIPESKLGKAREDDTSERIVFYHAFRFFA